MGVVHPPAFKKPDLVPILDEVTWAETLLPKGNGAGDPAPFLLSDGTNLYVYRLLFDCEALLNAGPSVEGVFEVLRERRWDAPKEEQWPTVAVRG
jgi:hypothetical protein